MPTLNPGGAHPVPDEALSDAISRAQRRAERAASAHAHTRVQAVARMLRPVFPTAATVVANLAGWYEDELIPTIIEIRDLEHTVLWREEDAPPPQLASEQADARWRDRRQAIEEHLSVVLEFATPSLAGWEFDDPDDDTAQYVITLTDAATSDPGGPAGQTAEVWVLRHIHHHGDDMSLYANHIAGLSALASAVRARWDNIIDDDAVPATPDQLSDQHAVDLYFQHRGELESYVLYADIVDGSFRRSR